MEGPSAGRAQDGDDGQTVISEEMLITMLRGGPTLDEVISDLRESACQKSTVQAPALRPLHLALISVVHRITVSF
jgi:hypothetical protein